MKCVLCSVKSTLLQFQNEDVILVQRRMPSILILLIKLSSLCIKFFRYVSLVGNGLSFNEQLKFTCSIVEFMLNIPENENESALQTVAEWSFDKYNFCRQHSQVKCLTLERSFINQVQLFITVIYRIYQSSVLQQSVEYFRFHSPVYST